MPHIFKHSILPTLITFAAIAGYALRPVKLPPYFDVDDLENTGCNKQRSVTGVVFSGEDERIGAGLALYASGKITNLFITGFEVKETAEELMARHGITNSRTSNEVSIDRLSRNTYESAVAAARFIQLNKSSMVVDITSAYHMARSAEFLRWQIDLPLFMYPVAVQATAAHKVGEGLKLAAARLFVPNIPLQQIGVLPLFSRFPVALSA